MNGKILFIGEHPAYLGGITRKCALLEKELKKYHEIKTISINVKDKKILSFGIGLLKMLFQVGRFEGVIYCLDNPRMYLLLRFQSFFFRRTLERTIVVYSGGSFEELEDEKYRAAIDCIHQCKQLWIEIRSVEDKLKSLAYKNVVYYPNPRIIETEKSPLLFTEERELKLLYYSQISKEKGLLDTIAIVNKLNENANIKFTIDFYGLVKEDVETQFKEFIDSTPNATYVGFNDAADLNQYYEVLNAYDIMLFPSYWIGEGIAGACVEAKIAGVAIIASNHNYNSEIVDVAYGEGAIYEKGDISGMVNEIVGLYHNPEKLNKMKEQSFVSRNRFNVDSYQILYEKCFE